MDYSGYDIIGDIHGCAKPLESLLQVMGYHLDEGIYCHPSRQAIFVGDMIDRGPDIRETLHIVKNMVDAGSAQCVLGNHEFSALAYTTPADIAPSDKILLEEAKEVEPKTQYVRKHNSHHNRLIAETLQQFEAYPEEWDMFLSWLRSLPFFIEMPEFRVVHACWDAELIEQYKRVRGEQPIDDEFICQTAVKGSFESRVVNRLTRGTELRLPEKAVVQSRDGILRRFFRTKFWAKSPETYADVVFQPDPLPPELAERSLTEQEKQSILSYGVDEPPVFMGHYWLHGEPVPQRDNIACLDYSAVKNGRLVAYRFDGEKKLSPDKFVFVDTDSLSQGEVSP